MTLDHKSAPPFSRRGIVGALYWLLAGFLLFAYGWLNYLRYFPPFAFSIQASAIVLLCIWGGWKVARREQLSRSPLALPMVALLGAATLATFFSIDPRRSFDGLTVTLVITLTFFLVGDLLLAGARPATFINMLLWLAALALGAGAWAIIQHYRAAWDLHAAGYPPFLFTYRLFGVFDHPNFLAALLNMAMPFAIVRLAQTRGFVSRLFSAGWLLVYVVVIYFTRSRGGWIAGSTAALTVVVGLSLWHGLPRRGAAGIWLRQNWRVWATTLAYGGLFLLLLRGPNLATLAFAALAPATNQAATDQSASPATAEETASAEPVQSDYSTNAGSTISEALQGHRMALWRMAWGDFVEHPLTGSGPLTFSYSFVEEAVAVRFWVPGYAHSLYVETLGTTGIAGAIALLWLLLRSGFGWGWALLRGFLLAPPPPATAEESEQRGVLLAVCAALASYLVHALVDMPGKMPLNDVVAVVLLALGAWGAGTLRPSGGTLSRWTAAIFVVPLALGLLLWRQSQAQEAMLNGAARALAGNWEDAARSLDTATRLDPAFAFYHGQRGYAYSVLADSLSEEAPYFAHQHALESYARSRLLEPPYIPNLLNNAALLNQAGEQQQAGLLLEQAVNLPQSRFWALPSLLLADRYAAQGREEEANELFAAAFASEPHAPQMAACRYSTACRSAAQQRPATTSDLHTRARALLQTGEPRQALELLDQVPLSSADPLPWIDRAAAHVALHDDEPGELAQARYALHVADRLRFANQYTASAGAPAALAHAAYALAHNKPAQAIAALEQAVLPTVTRDGYAYGIFRRVGLPGTFSPRLDLLQRTADDLEAFRLLAELYAREGRADRAEWAGERAAALALLLNEADERRNNQE
jgi:O-antigen ligase